MCLFLSLHEENVFQKLIKNQVISENCFFNFDKVFILSTFKKLTVDFISEVLMVIKRKLQVIISLSIDSKIQKQRNYYISRCCMISL